MLIDYYKNKNNEQCSILSEIFFPRSFQTNEFGKWATIDSHSQENKYYAASKTIAEVDKAFRKCAEKEECQQCQTQCAIEAEKVPDKILNRLYKNVMAKSSATFKQGLVKAQRQWLAYKKEDAALQAALHKQDAGSLSITLAAARSYEVMKERCEELEHLLSRL